MGDSKSQITDALQEALAAIDEANVPEPLQEKALERILDHLLDNGSPRSHQEQKHAAKPRERSGPRGGATADGSDDPVLAKVASALSVDMDAIEAVFDFDDDEVSLAISPSSLPDGKQAATIAIAYLIVAARNASGLDDGQTEPKRVKDAMELLGIEDSGNFWKYIDKTRGKGLVIRGTGTNRRLKINKAGYEKAAAIVHDLTEDADQ